MKNFLKININKILLLLIILFGAFFRFYGLNWDQGHHLHPDERFLTMVTGALEWPKNLAGYFSTATSPLNPHNQNFSFFVYGTFPIFLTKFLSQIFNFADYNNLTLFGRTLSGFFDVLTILLIFLIGKKVFSFKVGLFSSFLYSISVLPIQLSHFYTTDIFLNFFLILSLYLLINQLYSKNVIWSLLCGIAFGLAMASKINAVTFGSVLAIIFLSLLVKQKIKILPSILFFVLGTFLAFRIFQPYAFGGPTFFDISLNPKFIQNLEELNNLGQPGSSFPPAVQWNNTIPIIYPLKHMILWGLGLPLGIISLLSIFFVVSVILKKIKRNFRSLDNKIIILIALVFATLAIFTYQGLQFAKPVRYFITIYPLLALMSGYFLEEILKLGSTKIPKIWLSAIYCLLFAVFLVWPIAFFSIYTRPHSRVQASEWIYENISKGSLLGVEHWDDGLPLPLDAKRDSALYKFEELPMFAEDSDEKWGILDEKFKKINYLILSSNRAYGSVPRLPEKYPKTIKYYEDLFADKLEFKKVAEFTSRPTILDIEIIDDNADETFTVYDHPKVIVFKKTVP